jgi:HD-GYP domain-containing protein (c-di-GMP phosphodiesterase class II)
MGLLFGISTLILGGALIILYVQYKYIKSKLLDILDIFKIGREVNIEVELSKLIKQIVEIGKSKLSAEACTLYLLDEKKKELYFEVSIGDKAQLINRRTLKLGEGVAGTVALSGETLNIIDINEDVRFNTNREIANEIDFKEKAMLTLPVKSKNKVIGVLQFINKTNGKAFTEEDEELMEMLIELQVVPNLEKARSYEGLRNTFVDCIRGMAGAIEAKDIYTEEHCTRVAKEAVRLGKYMGLNEEDIRNLEYASLLHDVGKVSISDFIRSKTTPLTEDEIGEMKKHPILGSKILEPMDSLDESVKKAVRYHHEHYDGQGYCEGLKGAEIPLSARIIAVADAYVNLRTDTIFRKGVKREEALVAIKRGAGTSFDPNIVDSFNKMMLEEVS